MTFPIRALSLFFLATLTVRADALVEVRQLLARYPAKATVRGAVDFQTTNDRKEDGKPVVDQGRTVFRFEASPAGVSLLFPTAELERAQKEAHDERIDPEKKSPTRVALGEVNAAEVENYLDFAPSLVRDLQDAAVTDSRNVSFQGRPARQITFRVNPRFSKEEKKRVKSIAVTLRVWTDATGNFVGADKSFQMHFRQGLAPRTAAAGTARALSSCGEDGRSDGGDVRQLHELRRVRSGLSEGNLHRLDRQDES
jgi:hypothetical protein